jgi:hypothetical protein
VDLQAKAKKKKEKKVNPLPRLTQRGGASHD